MTEADWLSSAEPKAMLMFLKGKASQRKLRLFQVACCRRVWDLLPDQPCRDAVLVAERLADGAASDRERRAARERATQSPGRNNNMVRRIARSAVLRANEKTLLRTTAAFLGVAVVVGRAAHRASRPGTRRYREAYQAAMQAEADLVRCLFGNPFRPVALDPAWLAADDGLVVKVAESIDQRHAFDELPLLADALEDSECADEQLLGHCRGPGPHARGCFVVDELTART